MNPKNALPDFDGDNRDQRSWTRWMAEWLSDARKLQAGSACLPVHRLAAVPFHHRRFAMGRMDLERMRGVG